MKKLFLLSGFLLFSFSAFSDCIDQANAAVDYYGCDITNDPNCLAIWQAAYYACTEQED